MAYISPTGKQTSLWELQLYEHSNNLTDKLHIKIDDEQTSIHAEEAKCESDYNSRKRTRELSISGFSSRKCSDSSSSQSSDEQEKRNKQTKKSLRKTLI